MGIFFASAAVAPQGASRWHLNPIYCECEAFTVKYLTLPFRADAIILLVRKNKEDFSIREPAVSVNNLTKTFSGRTVVDSLSFQVEKGQVFALPGHNGAGKSTTIDLILGLKAPEGGSARLLGMDAASHRKQVFERAGVQLQNTRYQSNITVDEACMEYASLYAAPADYPRLLERFGLGPHRRNAGRHSRCPVAA